MPDAAAWRPPRLYAIVDVDVARAAGWSAEDLMQAVLDGGGMCLQLRAKHLASEALLRLGIACARRCQAAGATFILNDRADLAAMAGASGVHVGQEDLSPVAVRYLVGEHALVGLSTHTAAQCRAAATAPVSYVAMGPVFQTGTKETGYDAVGFERVAEARAILGDRPLVAIGGITLDRAPEVLEAGADAVALISDLVRHGDPAGRVRHLVDRLGRV